MIAKEMKWKSEGVGDTAEYVLFSNRKLSRPINGSNKS
jgi:hypothetical protein